jgi:predicted ferric reductase
MLFHRQMGIAACGFLAAHVGLLATRGTPAAMLNPFGGAWRARAGALALWLTLALVATSVWRRTLRLPYEGWQRAHGVAAAAIVVAMVVHVLTVGRHASAPLARGVVVGYAGLFLALLVRYRIVRPLQLYRQPWEVVANRDEGGSTRTVRVRPVGHPGFAFAPGQFAWLVTGRSPFVAEQHPITIASSAERPADGALEFAVKALGDWSRKVVPMLRPGTRLWVDGPYGVFTPDRVPGQGFVLIAGGIGISPMRSILATMRDRGDVRPVLLFYAARNWERVVFRDELDAFARTLALRTVYAFEEPPAAWTGERGWLTAEVLRRHLPPHHTRYQYFVCGPAAMMDALERALVEVGVPPTRTHTERFDMV